MKKRRTKCKALPVLMQQFRSVENVLLVITKGSKNENSEQEFKVEFINWNLKTEDLRQ